MSTKNIRNAMKRNIAALKEIATNIKNAQNLNELNDLWSEYKKQVENMDFVPGMRLSPQQVRPSVKFTAHRAAVLNALHESISRAYLEAKTRFVPDAIAEQNPANPALELTVSEEPIVQEEFEGARLARNSEVATQANGRPVLMENSVKLNQLKRVLAQIEILKSKGDELTTRGEALAGEAALNLADRIKEYSDKYATGQCTLKEFQEDAKKLLSQPTVLDNHRGSSKTIIHNILAIILSMGTSVLYHLIDKGSCFFKPSTDSRDKVDTLNHEIQRII